MHLQPVPGYQRFRVVNREFPLETSQKFFASARFARTRSRCTRKLVQLRLRFASPLRKPRYARFPHNGSASLRLGSNARFARIPPNARYAR